MKTAEQAAEIFRLQAQAHASKAELLVTERQLAVRVEQLYAAIRSGESTGNKPRDFCMVRYGGMGLVGADMELLYQRLDAQLRKHVGEFVLMVMREEKPLVDNECREPHPEEYGLVESLYLGVITDGALFVRAANNECAIAVNGHCQNTHDGKAAFVVGNIVLDFYHDYGLHNNQPLECKGSYVGWTKPIIAMEVLIGDTEVKAWLAQLANKQYLELFNEMAKLLGRSVADFPELEAHRQARKDALLKDFTQRFLGWTIVHAEIREVVTGMVEQARNLGISADTPILSVRDLWENLGVKKS